MHVAHHEIRLAVRDARAVDGQHVRVLDRRRGARLAQEALARPLVVDALGRDDLDGDLAVELELMRAIDDAHSAAPDRLLDPTTLELRPGDEHAHVGCIADWPLSRGAIGRSAVAITTSVSYSRKLFAEPDDVEHDEPARIAQAARDHGPDVESRSTRCVSWIGHQLPPWSGV